MRAHDIKLEPGKFACIEVDDGTSALLARDEVGLARAFEYGVAETPIVYMHKLGLTIATLLDRPWAEYCGYGIILMPADLLIENYIIQ